MSPFRRQLGRVAVACYRRSKYTHARLLTLAISGAFAELGARSVLEPPIRFQGERRIAIGERVFIGAGSWLQAVGEQGGVALSIGDGTSIAGSCVLSAATSVRIGSNVLFASNVYVSDHNHAFSDPTRPIIQQGITEPRPVEIGDGAWLGENVVICPGVRIGAGAVVGANAVVRDDVPDHAVAVGIPARIVRVFASVPDSQPLSAAH